MPTVSKDTAYSQAVVWFENNHDRAGIRVTTRDPDTATIVGTGEMQCNASVGSGLRAMGLGANQNYLRFNVAFQAKDGRFRIVFSELYYYVTDMRYNTNSLQQGPANRAEVDALYRECLQPLEVSLLRAVNAHRADSDF